MLQSVWTWFLISFRESTIFEQRKTLHVISYRSLRRPGCHHRSWRLAPQASARVHMFHHHTQCAQVNTASIRRAMLCSNKADQTRFGLTKPSQATSELAVMLSPFAQRNFRKLHNELPNEPGVLNGVGAGTAPRVSAQGEWTLLSGRRSRALFRYTQRSVAVAIIRDFGSVIAKRDYSAFFVSSCVGCSAPISTGILRPASSGETGVLSSSTPLR